MGQKLPLFCSRHARIGPRQNARKSRRFPHSRGIPGEFHAFALFGPFQTGNGPVQKVHTFTIR
jgi:hypothetical protein